MTDGEHAHQLDSMWTDESWREWDDYADLVSVEVRFKEWAGAVDADERWLLSTDGAAWSKDWLKREVIDLAAVGSSGGCCGRGTYLLDSRERTTEWGASASVFEVVLTLAQDQLSNATWAALGALSAKLAGRLRKRRVEQGGFEEMRWDTEAASSAAFSAVRRVHELTLEAVEALKVTSVERRDDGVMVVEIREGTSGSVYTVDVRSPGGEVYLARVRKISEPGAQ
jgi:hypothetical protein